MNNTQLLFQMDFFLFLLLLDYLWRNSNSAPVHFSVKSSITDKHKIQMQ